MDGLRYENPVKAKLKNGQKTAGAFCNWRIAFRPKYSRGPVSTG